MDRPFVLCGLGRMGARVLEHLHKAGFPVVVIDTVCKPDDPRLAGARLVRGDCRRREVLEEAGVADARGVLVLTADDLLNITTALLVRGLNGEVRIVLRMFNQNLLARLGKAVHNVFALSTSLLTAPILALTALSGQALGSFRLDESASGLRQLVEVTVGPASPLRGQTLGAIASQRGVVVAAHLPADAEPRFLLDVDASASAQVGDHLVVYGEPLQLSSLLTADRARDAEIRWANIFRRLGRMVWRTFAEVDRAVLVCSLVLVGVLAVSTAVLYTGVTRFSAATALLRAVSIMATGGGIAEDDYSDGVQVYVSFLRILGAVLMAAFTAIVTNYLLRARLGGVLEVRRVPEGGHVIVCGLSTVGFRVVEELVRLGERVVVIDRDAGCRFVPTARRLGAAVMIGDAGVVEVLRQANASTAKAVVPATSNDMTNLEVALLVRELNPAGRVVPLVNDPQFAQMLRDAAGIRLAVSVPALAAPAFLAGLFGDRVASVFLLRDRLFAVLDLLIHADDPFVGHTVRAVAVDYRVLPIGHLRPGDEASRSTLAGRLDRGDRLIGLVALADLQRLLRRQPSSAAYAVEVDACPLPTRPWLAGLVRLHGGLDPEQAVGAYPLRLAAGLTRGQAEDLLAQLTRERVAGRVCLVEGAG
jgi:Trk K+ transport system NAD-binding subunit